MRGHDWVGPREVKAMSFMRPRFRGGRRRARVVTAAVWTCAACGGSLRLPWCAMRPGPGAAVPMSPGPRMRPVVLNGCDEVAAWLVLAS